MTSEEFFEKYIEEDLVDLFDEICNFFSKDLPQNFEEDYDVGEIVIETFGQNLSDKKIDNVLAFAEILKTKQPNIYRELFSYIDDFLVDYYCFQRDHKNTQNAFELFLEKPLRDIDKYLLQYKKILYYQESELVKKAITENFDTISESDEIIAGAEYDLAISMFYIKLQEVFQDNDDHFDKSEFSSKLNDYNLSFEDNFLESLETGLFKPQYNNTDLKKLYKHKSDNTLTVIQGYYLRYMYNKGFPFYLSGHIWDNLQNFWKKHNSSKKTLDSYFDINSEKFKEQILDISLNIFLDGIPDMNALLWGSVYIYDFLYNNNIISRETYDDFKQTSKMLKGKIIAQHTADLWNSDFIHGWEKADSISETEFLEEHKIFEKSLYLKAQKFTRLRSNISEELSKIGELSHYIIEGGKSDADNLDGLNKLFDTPSIEEEEEIEEEMEEEEESEIVKPAKPEFVQKPIQNGKKVGRNDPCPCGSGKKYKKCCGKK